MAPARNVDGSKAGGSHGGASEVAGTRTIMVDQLLPPSKYLVAGKRTQEHEPAVRAAIRLQPGYLLHKPCRSSECYARQIKVVAG